MMINVLIFLACFLLVGSALGIAAFIKTRQFEQRLRAIESRLQKLSVGESVSSEAAAPPEHQARLAPDNEPQDGQADMETGIAEDTTASEEEGPGQTQDSGTPQSASLPHTATGISGDASGRGRAGQSDTGRPRQQSLEERIGTRWAVWIGGLALVLGGVFLVHYSIEAGLLTPLARVLAGALLALALLGAGEWLRRKEVRSTPEGTRQAAYVPGILTLAGTTTAFASVFAAHALYGLIGASFAFVLLAIVALMTLVAAVVHGPAVASYGLIASYIVPFLVQADQPALWPLALYGISVTFAAYAVARIRLWCWLAFAAAGGAVFWGHVMAFANGGSPDVGALATYDLAVFAMAVFVFVVSFHPREAAKTFERSDWPATVLLFLHAFPILYLLQIDVFGPVSLLALIVVVAAMLVLATDWPVSAPVALGSTVLAVLAYLSWDVPLASLDVQQHPFADSRIAAALANPSAEGFLRVGTMLGLLSGGLGLWGAWKSTGRWALAPAGVATPLALLGIAYLRLEPFETSMLFGPLALALAAAFLALLVFLDRHLPENTSGREAARVAYAVGTIGAIAIGMAILLQDGWLPVGLALLAAGTIWVHTKWPLPALPWVGLGVAGLTCAAIAWEPTIVGSDRLATTPFANALLYGYGVPALAFGYCAWRLGQSTRNQVQQLFEALTIFSLLVTAAVLIHHAMNGGAFYAPSDTLAEWSLHTLVLLAGGLAVQRLDRIAHSPVLDRGSLLLGLLGFAAIARLHLVTYNPLFSGESVGQGLLFNLLFVAYLLPALLCTAIALWTGGARPRWYRLIAGALAGALMFAWISLEVRAYFHRPHLDTGASSAAELYSYSAAWLLFGIVLLLVGHWRGSRMIRLASLVFVLAAIAKVFLFDMAGLDGAWRALSFIGLGVALIGIGLLYQRLLRGAPEAPSPSVDETP